MARPLLLLIGAVTLGGGVELALGASQFTADNWRLLITLVALGAMAERWSITLFNSHVSVGVVTVLVAAIVAGPWGVAVVAPAIALAGQLRTDAPWYKRLYNVGVYVIAGNAFAGIFDAFGSEALPDAWPVVLLPAMLGALANFAINTGLVAGAVALSRGEHVIQRWWQSYGWLAPQYLIIGLTAAAIATAYHVMGPWGIAVFAAPVAGIRQAFTPRDQADEPAADHLPKAA